MTTTRSYADDCGVARALDVVGERWALLVVRELLFGPKRFTDLRAGLPSASPNVLSERLRALEAHGIVVRRTLGPPARARVYELTPRGAELRPAVVALGRWGSAGAAPPEAAMSIDAHGLALLALFDAAAAADVTATYGLGIEDDVFALTLAGGVLDLRRGTAEGARATLATDRPTLRALLWEGRALEEAEAAGDARVEGSHKALRRLLKLFPRPG